MKILIENGLVVDPSAEPGMEPEKRPLIIENGVFADPETWGGATPDRIIDAGGLYVFPGLIDAHCHLRDPGYEYKEDIISGTLSAAHGGFSTVACMPNTKPVCDHAALVRYILEKAERSGFARVLPIGAVSKGQQGKELAEIGLMAEAGAVAISDDGHPVAEADLMRKAMLYASQFGLTVISHCEDLSLAADGQMNEGAWSTMLGLRGIPDLAESVMAARDCLLAEYLQIPVHLAHISCRRSVRIIREAKARGVKVTAETCPHYFTLTEADCRGFNTQAKMNPPLRTADDVAAIIEGLADGTIDLIATDHAPHHQDEKELEFALANNGIVGFETALPLGYTFLVRPGKLSLTAWLRTMTTNPARLLRQPTGTLQPGRPADLVLVDLDHLFRFDKNQMASRSRNTPYQDWELYGKVRGTFCAGRMTYDTFC
ncbi:MAG: dihydroorotase [Clostridiaceae bacterium]|nr:dihydroorotase [Clostridiaceae bacterium]